MTEISPPICNDCLRSSKERVLMARHCGPGGWCWLCPRCGSIRGTRDRWSDLAEAFAQAARSWADGSKR